jgi:hypothetical protein
MAAPLAPSLLPLREIEVTNRRSDLARGPLMLAIMRADRAPVASHANRSSPHVSELGKPRGDGNA